MKKYKSPVMMKKGRYSEYFLTLPEETKSKILSKMDEYTKKLCEYCDKGNYSHMCNIVSCLAIYETLQEDGMSKEDALQVINDEMHKFVEKHSAPTYRKMFARKGMLKFMGRILPWAFSKGSGVGWRYVWHRDTSTDYYLQFECHECIYAKIFKSLGTPELGPAFCFCDDINYGSIPGIKFTRNHTLCRDGQVCDFKFEKQKPEEKA